ncbi:MAG: imidazoleglycerol-phosphate dehydratase HisB [Termitinemataceae bacterium]|nr:MAG: imidazoleglycerol-phosphate dehydratase HisB [Termitinemataceae bacterium]
MQKNLNRSAEITRKTAETDIYIKLGIDGCGAVNIDMPIGFLAHMLNTFARHGLFDLEVRASGDLHVDQHHLVEDTGIVLGSCFAKALGSKTGITRVGSCLYPMDETLAQASCDICGRPFLVFNGALSNMPLVSAGASFQTDTVQDFWQGFAESAGCALHLDVLRGRSDHHKIEAMFKAAARSLRAAVEIDERAAEIIPSTKGVL